jgi:Leucine-rich repeat (LRR) protein
LAAAWYDDGVLLDIGRDEALFITHGRSRFRFSGLNGNSIVRTVMFGLAFQRMIAMIGNSENRVSTESTLPRGRFFRWPAAFQRLLLILGCIACGCAGDDEPGTPANDTAQQTGETGLGTTDVAGTTKPEAVTLPGGLPENEREAAEAFLKLGAVVVQGDSGEVTSLDLTGTKVSDQNLSQLQAFTELQSLILTDTKISNDGLKHVAGLASLQTLELYRTSISDAGLKHLAGLSGLAQLYLKGTEITDDGLEHVGRLTNLTLLSLSNTKITDEGLKHLRALTHLESLLIEETAITDEGLFPQLKELTKLQLIRLHGTQVSAAGIRSLKESLPRVRIVGP